MKTIHNVRKSMLNVLKSRLFDTFMQLFKFFFIILRPKR